MLETIKEFFASPEFTTLVAGVLAWLAANAGTLIIFAIKYIKLKASETAVKKENDEIIQALEARYGVKTEELLNKFNDRMDAVEKAVLKKMAEADALEQENINHESELLEKALEDAKKSLNQDNEE